MYRVFNVYCDESCHLENDKQLAMVLGAVWHPLEFKHEVSEHILGLKNKHGIAPDAEIKWTKISPAKTEFYLDLIDYFFSVTELRYRALIVPDKGILRHDDYSQDHDEWYYKMYFTMLRQIIAPPAQYRIYLDIKDTRGGEKVGKLHDVLCSDAHDFSGHIIARVQTIHSHESAGMQLTDLLTGALSYVNRNLSGSAAKLEVVQRIKECSGLDLLNSTGMAAEKINILRWQPRG